MTPSVAWVCSSASSYGCCGLPVRLIPIRARDGDVLAVHVDVQVLVDVQLHALRREDLNVDCLARASSCAVFFGHGGALRIRPGRLAKSTRPIEVSFRGAAPAKDENGQQRDDQPDDSGAREAVEDHPVPAVGFRLRAALAGANFGAWTAAARSLCACAPFPSVDERGAAGRRGGAGVRGFLRLAMRGRC